MVVGLCHEVSKGALHFGIIGRIFIKLGFDFSGADHELITDAFHAMELFDLGDALVASPDERGQKLDSLNVLHRESLDVLLVDKLNDCSGVLHQLLLTRRTTITILILLPSKLLLVHFREYGT